MVTQCSQAATTRKNRDIYLLRFIATTSGVRWIKGCLENSDLEASDLRPQTSDLKTSDLENSDLKTSDPLKNEK